MRFLIVFQNFCSQTSSPLCPFSVPLSAPLPLTNNSLQMSPKIYIPGLSLLLGSTSTFLVASRIVLRYPVKSQTQNKFIIPFKIWPSSDSSVSVLNIIFSVICFKSWNFSFSFLNPEFSSDLQIQSFAKFCTIHFHRATHVCPICSLLVIHSNDV